MVYSSMEQIHPSGSPALRFLRDQPPSTFLLKVQKSSLLVKAQTAQTYESQIFIAAGYTWKLVLYPNGNTEDGGEEHISFYLQIQDTAFLPIDWEINVDMKLCAYKHDEKKFLMAQDLDVKRFNASKTQWGFARFLPLETFNNEENGYLFEDKCEFGAEIFVVQPTKKTENDTFVEDEAGNTTFSTKDSSEPSNPSKCPNIQRAFRVLNPAHCIFPIKSFSQLRDKGKEPHESAAFEAGGFKWKLVLYPRGHREGNKEGEISLYLRIVETKNFNERWNVHAFFRFFVRDQINDKYLTIQEPLGKEMKRFHELKKEYGIVELLSLEEFANPSKGYIVEDKCYFGAEVFVASPPRGFTTDLTTSDATFLWTIEKFSDLKDTVFSKPFFHGGTLWRFAVYPNGFGKAKDKSLSVFLHLYEPLNAPKNKEWQTSFTLTVLNMKTMEHKSMKVNSHCFRYSEQGWGFSSLIALEKLNEEEGFKIDDKVSVEVKFNSMTMQEITTKKDVSGGSGHHEP